MVKKLQLRYKSNPLTSNELSNDLITVVRKKRVKLIYKTYTDECL